MISLSRLLKHAQVAQSSHMKKISFPNEFHASRNARHQNEQSFSSKQTDAAAEAEQLKQAMLADAQQHAEMIVEQAKQEAENIISQAKAEAEAWFVQKREEDQQLENEAKQRGFQEGYREGAEKAEREMQEKYAAMIEEAAAVLHRAQEEKQRRIAESESFLVELSCDIAEKIIGKQLTLESAWKKDLVKQMLSRKREQGLITLCVSPKSYSFMQDAREELRLVLGPNSDLQVIPDLTVKDDGCIIRSEYGSIDARIDTQLQEIKQKLLQAAQDSEAYYNEQHVSGK